MLATVHLAIRRKGGTAAADEELTRDFVTELSVEPRPWREIMRIVMLVVVLSALSGCASPTPQLVFQEATEAFASGSVEEGTAHFSTRLKEVRRLQDLRRYYADEKRREGVRYLLDGHHFEITSEEGDRAVGEVTWRNGRREPVYFVLEKGVWKLDLPPTTVRPAQAEVVEDFDQAKADYHDESQ